MSLKPLTINVGQIEQLPSGQALDVGGWTLPTAGGTEDYTLSANVGGNAVWTAPTFGASIPANVSANQVYVGTGVGTAAWTTDLVGLTSLTVDSITIDAAVITSDTGAISFSNENLITTGSMTANIITDGTASLIGGSLTGVKLGSLGNGFVKTSGGDGTLSVDASTYLTAEADTLDTVADRGATTDKTLTTAGLTSNGQLIVTHNAFAAGKITRTTGSTSGGGSALQVVYESSGDAVDTFGPGISFAISDTGVTDSQLAGIFGVRQGTDTSGSLEFYTNNSGTFTSKGRISPDGTFTIDAGIIGSQLNIDNITIDSSTISSSIGTIFFDDDDLTTTGIITGGQLKIDSIGINGAIISSSSGAISFSNENVSTIGTMVGSNIPSPTGVNQTLISTGADTANWITAPWTKSLTSSVTVYVRTTGSDITGDGSIGDPYLTLAKAIEVIGHWHIGTHFITVDIGEGVFSEPHSSKFYHLYGNQVIFKGVSEKITGQDTNSISGSSTSLHSNLSYYDVTFILPVGKSVSVGDYIAVRDVSGGTNPEGLYGCHYVSTWVSGTRTATVRVVFRDGSTKASGTVTCTISLIKTVITYDNSPGIEAVSGYSAGTWYGMVIEGNYNPTTKTEALFGVWANNGSSIFLGGSEDSGTALGVVGFNVGLYSQNNSGILALKSFVSNCAGICAYALNSSNLFLDGCRISGSNYQSIYGNIDCNISADSVKVVASGDNTVSANNFSYIVATNAWIGLNNATYSMYADNMSGINGNSATISPASVSPAVDGNNDGSRVIGQ